MLQQTVIAAMLPVYERFLERFPTVQSVADSTEDELKKTVKGLGYYRRFALLRKGAQKIVEASPPLAVRWPRNYEEWLQIPGVGDYTAAAMSSITCNEAAPVLDGNVIRVLARIFDQRMPANDRSVGTFLKLKSRALIDPFHPGDFNQGMMEIGQTICRPLQPSCHVCPLQNVCLASSRESTHLAPLPKVRKAAVPVKLRVNIIEQAGLIGLFPRGQGAKFLRGTQGFPLSLRKTEGYSLDGYEARLAEGKPLGTFRHHITQHKIEAEVCLLNGSGSQANVPGIRWVEKSQVSDNLMSSLDLKAWRIAHDHL